MVLLYDGNVVADAETQAFLRINDDRVQRFVQGRADDDDLAAIRRGFNP
jgi:ABC-type transporter Mla maintaining outer membrane lipid asymmetry ATPase subunit MlaF